MTDVVNATPAADAPADTSVQATGADGKPVDVPGADATPAEIKKWKLKIDGKDIDAEEADVIRWAQKGKKADQEMQTAAQIKKQNQALIKRLKDDPIAVMMDPAIGHDMKKLMSEYLSREAEEAKLTPEQKKLRDTEAKLREFEEREEGAKKASRQAEIDKMAEEQHAIWDKDIKEALVTSGLPKTQWSVERIAHWLGVAIRAGKGDSITVAQVVPFVKEDWVKAQREMYGAADEDTLAELLGDELLGKVSKAHVKKVQGKQKVTESKPEVITDTGKKGELPKTKNMKDWLKQF